jgi:radical SAM superfamily enzyme YgiQ (UPF0313 family)
MRILYLPNAYSQQRQREKKAKIYPVKLAMEAEYYRLEGALSRTSQRVNQVDWDSGIKGGYDKIIIEPENLPFLSLPRPDRIFTRAREYSSGNYKYEPGTHMQVADGCWHGKCAFCIEKDRPYLIRQMPDIFAEIAQCERLGFREIFDDSGTFPIGGWLDEFCENLKHFNIRFSCNMRAVDLDYVKMRRAGFRMLLFGIESASEFTLKTINKGTTPQDVKYIIKAERAGLEPHIAVMFGYPWETDAEAIETLKLARWLLRKGYAKTAQASFYTPPNGLNNENHRKYVRRIYGAGLYPDFWLNRLGKINNIDELKYLWKGIKSIWR